MIRLDLKQKLYLRKVDLKKKWPFVAFNDLRGHISRNIFFHNVSNVAFMLAFHQNWFINKCARKKIAKIPFDVLIYKYIYESITNNSNLAHDNLLKI